MSSNDSILIVGGGIAGLAAACALARNGFRSTVLEQAAEFAEIGAGVQFGPNALKMLQRIGFLTSDLDRISIYPDSAVMIDSVTGEEVVRIPFGEPFQKRFKQPYALVHRADLHRSLLEAAQRSNLVELHTSIKVNDISQKGDEVIASSERGETFQGTALIGADGLWSTVRQFVLDDGKPRISGHVTYRAALAVDDIPATLRNNVMTLWAGDNVHAVHYPLRGGEMYNLAATFQSKLFSDGWDSFGKPEELFDSFSGKHPLLRGLLDKIEIWRMWMLCDREPVKNWTKGRVTLIGDAAHPMLQYIGQGAAMSLEDAVCLAQEVWNAPTSFEAAALNYQAKRYLRTARAQITARLYGGVYHANNTTRELRNSWLSKMPQGSYDSLAWMYDYEG
jgi:3-hydroxybenzoate 6-monooxygenase